MFVYFFAVAATIGFHVDEQRRTQPHLSVRASFQLERCAVNVHQPSQYTPAVACLVVRFALISAVLPRLMRQEKSGKSIVVDCNL